MVVEIFSICDAATDYGGRLNLLGIFEGVAAVTAPILRERCSVAIRLRFDASESGEHAVVVRLIGSNGEEVLPGIAASLNVALRPGRESGAFNLVLNLNRLVLPRFGRYELQLRVDETLQRSLPLLALKAKPGARSSGRMEN